MILEEMKYHKTQYYTLLRELLQLSKLESNIQIDLDRLEIVELE